MHERKCPSVMRQDGQLRTGPPDRSWKMLSCRTMPCACASMPAAEGSPPGRAARRAARALSILQSTAVSDAEAYGRDKLPAH